MDTLQISTSAKRIAIERDGSQVGELVINPADVLFVEKYYRLVSEFETKFNEYQTHADALGENQAENIGERLKLLTEACSYVREKIDHVFGAGTSQMVFGDSMELDVIAQFLDGINPYLKTARTKKISQYVPVRNKSPRKRKANGR